MRQKILQTMQAHQSLTVVLLAEMSTYSDAQLNRRPREGAWSALQTAHHVLLAETLALQYVRKKLSFEGAHEKKSLRSSWRRMLLWFYLNLPFKFKAPEVVAEERLPANSTMADLREAWEASNADWLSFFQNMPDQLADKTVYRHPLAGRLSWKGMLHFFKLHLLRHRLQIQKTLQNV